MESGNEGMEDLRRCLLGELQKLRENIGAIEEKVDHLLLERLQQHEPCVGKTGLIK